MESIFVEESELLFGPFPPENCFYIEKSETYVKAVNKETKISEFVLIKKGKGESTDLLIIEAKKSSPHPKTEIRFNEFIGEIHEKMDGSISILASLFLGRISKLENDLPIALTKDVFVKANIKLILVVKNCEKKWLPPLQSALQKKLKRLALIWNFKPCYISVINEDMARKKQLISSDSETVGA